MLIVSVGTLALVLESERAFMLAALATLVLLLASRRSRSCKA